MLRLATPPNMWNPDSLPSQGPPAVSEFLKMRRSCSAVWNEAAATVAHGFANRDLFLRWAPAGFAPEDSLSVHHGADSCETQPQKLPIIAKTTSTPAGALIKAPQPRYYRKKG